MLIQKKFSILELLHPDGSASTSFVLGHNCPETLFIESQIGIAPKIELLILAPTVGECSSEGWLEGAVEFIGQQLANDGVGYVLAPLPWRLKILRLLYKAGLVIDSSFWHSPDWESSQYLVPLEGAPAEFAVETIIPAPFWKRTIARQMFHNPGARWFLSVFWRPVGMSVRRPGARPLFQWLFKSDHEQPLPGTAIIRTSWRGSHGANILYCFSECDPLPLAVAKTVLVESTSASPEREAQALENLGPRARSAGALVPQILHRKQNDQHQSLLLSVVQGRSVSDLLDSNSSLLDPVMERIVDWLEHWHLETVNVRPLGIKQLERDLLVPLDLLAPFLEGSQGYLAWLEAQIHTAVGIPIPLVATHNDLTMANILLDGNDVLGVVDWETGRAESWPLVDFYYAVTDAVRIAAAGCNDWLGAFTACYRPEGLYAPKVSCWQGRLRSAIKISPDLAELSFHACWLHHAANEQRVSQPGDPRPFLQIVQWLALNYSKSNEN